MSNNPPHGPPPPYYGYPTSGPAPPHPGGYTYVPAPVMMPVYHPQPPPPPPDLMPQPQPTYVTNYIYQQQPQPPPPPQPIHVEVTEVKYEPQTSKPWDNVAGIGLATVEKGLAWLGNSLQTLNNNNNVNRNHGTCNTISVINKELIDWVPATTLDVSSLAHKAFIAGKEGWDGSPLCVIRAHHSGEFIPGKLALKHRSAYVPHAGKEVPVHNFEVLCAPSHAVRWLPSSNGQVPVGAIAAGNTHHGEPLYIARVKHLRSITPGKVHPSHGCCYISFGGSEISYKSYEVLCKIVG